MHNFLTFFTLLCTSSVIVITRGATKTRGEAKRRMNLSDTAKPGQSPQPLALRAFLIIFALYQMIVHMI